MILCCVGGHPVHSFAGQFLFDVSSTSDAESWWANMSPDIAVCFSGGKHLRVSRKKTQGTQLNLNFREQRIIQVKVRHLQPFIWWLYLGNKHWFLWRSTSWRAHKFSSEFTNSSVRLSGPGTDMGFCVRRVFNLHQQRNGWRRRGTHIHNGMVLNNMSTQLPSAKQCMQETKYTYIQCDGTQQQEYSPSISRGVDEGDAVHIYIHNAKVLSPKWEQNSAVAAIWAGLEMSYWLKSVRHRKASILWVICGLWIKGVHEPSYKREVESQT